MNIFNVRDTYTSDENLHKDLEKINKMLEKNLDDFTLKEFNELIYLYERSSISLRRKLEDGDIDDDGSYFTKNDFGTQAKRNNKKNRFKFIENLPVKVEKIGDIYHIFCSYTFKKKINESFYLASILKAAVAVAKENGMNFEFNGKQLCVVLRVDKENFSNKYSYKDNDNLETTELINFIFTEAACVSDNVKNMSYFSHFMTTDDESLHGFHMFVLPYDSEEIRPERLLKIVTKNTKN